MSYTIDLFAIFIFLGVVQSLFLSVFFFSGDNRKSKSNLFAGLLLIVMAACSFEILLMYTGYIIHCLYLVDFSEPFAFLIGPLVFLLTIAFIKEKLPRLFWLHFIPSLVYLILIIPFLIAPDDVKYNAWVESYKLPMPFRSFDYESNNPRVFWLTNHHTLLTLISIVGYAIFTSLEVFRFFRRSKESFIKPSGVAFKKLRAIVLQICLVTVLILVVKAFNKNDTGDHMFTAYFTVLIYLVSFRVMRSSGFFSSPAARDKVSRSLPISDADQVRLVEKISLIMEHEKPYLNADFSLPELARLSNTTVHNLSQLINTVMGQSFFELTAKYRVEEAKHLLISLSNLKVEEIAEKVGYSSRSSFNTVFKKHTGFTPSQYREKQLASSQ